MRFVGKSGPKNDKVQIPFSNDLRKMTISTNCSMGLQYEDTVMCSDLSHSLKGHPEEEAEATMVDFFYDDEGSRIDGRMKILKAHCVAQRHSERDICIIGCVSCDDSLIERLNQISFPELPPSPLATTEEFAPSEREGLCVVLSHPHGR
ncbi:hypothetical protein PoB_006812900 [Plakobranchus ocellatus]|uniref:Uncharacterized protein n=1 Tax=Plakobranchus ocellatus TaxID=259542 RepID=A0AAV4DBT3_9GAST|nr:hypothetical protein PoB_006812900 [Plakobranchus ocellatus]